VNDTSVRTALICEDERPWRKNVAEGQANPYNDATAKLHSDTKVRREYSRRIQGLEYLRDHDEELIALYYKQSDRTLLWVSPTGII